MLFFFDDNVRNFGSLSDHIYSYKYSDQCPNVIPIHVSRPIGNVVNKKSESKEDGNVHVLSQYNQLRLAVQWGFADVMDSFGLNEEDVLRSYETGSKKNKKIDTNYGNVLAKFSEAIYDD